MYSDNLFQKVFQNKLYPDKTSDAIHWDSLNVDSSIFMKAFAGLVP